MSQCRLPVDFIIPCSCCDYYEGCKSSSNWEVDLDYLQREFEKEFTPRSEE